MRLLQASFAAVLTVSTAFAADAAPIANPSAVSVASTANIPVERVQYVWGGRSYCWYPGGWHGPGWYWCGYAWRAGFGWGGPVGWRGWVWRGPGWHGGVWRGPGWRGAGWRGAGWHGGVWRGRR